MSDIPVELSTADLWTINAAVALMMLGASLTFTPADLRRAITIPRAPIAGLLAQFLLLPALTSLAVWAFAIPAELGLGMILLACCPGGTFSNVMTWIAKGSLGVSVTMTAVSSLAATILTPINFALWAGVNPRTRPILEDIAVSPLEVLVLIVAVLFLPIVLGMAIHRRHPDATRRNERLVRVGTTVLFLVIIALAVASNLALLADTIGTLVPIVALHNAAALGIGYLIARTLRLGSADTRAVTLEVGIQNASIGLAIAFTFLPELGDAILVLAMWGVWHLLGGMTVALLWARRPPAAAPPADTRSVDAA